MRAGLRVPPHGCLLTTQETRATLQGRSLAGGLDRASPRHLQAEASQQDAWRRTQQNPLRTVKGTKVEDARVMFQTEGG